MRIAYMKLIEACFPSDATGIGHSTSICIHFLSQWGHTIVTGLLRCYDRSNRLKKPFDRAGLLTITLPVGDTDITIAPTDESYTQTEIHLNEIYLPTPIPKHYKFKEYRIQINSNQHYKSSLVSCFETLPFSSPTDLIFSQVDDWIIGSIQSSGNATDV